MISIKLVEEIHETLIAQFEGSYGLRDIEALQSALARPFQLLIPGTCILL